MEIQSYKVEGTLFSILCVEKKQLLIKTLDVSLYTFYWI